MRPNIDRITTDVLVVGGGLAGSMAAIQAAQSGARVVVVEKANTKRSGAAGTGNDHFGIWHPEIHGNAGWTIEDVVKEQTLMGNEDQELAEIVAKSSYERALDLESFGCKFRFNQIYPWNYGVEPGEYAPGQEQFRIVPQFYSVPCTLNYEGRDIKRVLTAQMKEHGVEIVNRIMSTALLTQDDAVVGAAGFHTRTGAFAVFRAKTVILATGRALRVRLLRDQGGDLFNSMNPPNCTGDGHVMALKAGAKMGVRLPRYSDGGLAGADLKGFPRTALIATSSYPAAKIVNAAGEVVAERLYAPHPPSAARPDKVAADIKEGRWPFYVDLTQATEQEIQYAEWSLSHESTTWAALRVFQEEGIDLRTHRLELSLKKPGFYGGLGTMSFGVFVDQECRASLKNLWAVGDMLMQIGGSAVPAICLGWRAGEMAAHAALEQPLYEMDDRQVRQEMDRVFAPLDRTEGVGWEEVNHILVDIIENYVAGQAVGGASEVQSPYALQAAVDQLHALRALPFCAAGPHELMRSVEVMNLIDQAAFLVRACQEEKLRDPAYWSLGWLAGGEIVFGQEPKVFKYPIERKSR
jgi:succinate dehydrogenase/fumarate reductase flavoprotein subunit